VTVPTSTPNIDITTTSIAPVLQCPMANGMFRYPYDCSKFFMCINSLNFIFECPFGLYFDEAKGYCNFPCNVECNV